MRFCTGDASGSTSQAANVIEAIESGASALLVDEDVSAALFMAHDGRMRVMKRQFSWRTGRD
jgi:predicted ABC-class ATPase